MRAFDLLIVGSGPAGMAAAIEARRHGLEVLVIDEQATPGGQIWRSIELSERRDDILGAAYIEGRHIAKMFRASGARYEPATQLWQIETGYRVFVSHDGRAEALKADAIVLATGAQERPIPFEGWTLPGVLTVGAAQILLKSAGQVPVGPVWIAGSGPLPLLYATQFLRAGGNLAGYLDTTPSGQWKAALPHLPAALRSVRDLAKGLHWQSSVRKRSAVYACGVDGISALGTDRIQAIRYTDRDGNSRTVDARTLLVHEGVVPNVHPALSLGCEMTWSTQQDCFVPATNEWGESSLENLFIAGDGAGIAGARAALLRGTLAGLSIAIKLGRTDLAQAQSAAATLRRKLRRELAVRPFLDALFRPRAAIFSPPDDTIICRCEEVAAGTIRAAAAVNDRGPNQIKAASRAGMGPCQGRQCGYTLTRLIAEAQKRSPAQIGYLHIRPPLKPVTLAEVATLKHEACE